MALKPRPAGAPDLIAGYPVNDPDLTYLGFALSGYGFVYNPNYLKERGLPVPRGWSDLAAPIYAGHIGISSPSRSGTMHLMVDTILQVYGWDRGWGIWSEIGGNLATVTARSFGVSAGVARGRFGVGPSIDFLANPEGMPGVDPVHPSRGDAVRACQHRDPDRCGQAGWCRTLRRLRAVARRAVPAA